jgi:hypothetical protein
MVPKSRPKRFKPKSSYNRHWTAYAAERRENSSGGPPYLSGNWTALHSNQSSWKNCRNVLASDRRKCTLAIARLSESTTCRKCGLEEEYFIDVRFQLLLEYRLLESICVTKVLADALRKPGTCYWCDHLGWTKLSHQSGYQIPSLFLTSFVCPFPYSSCKLYLVSWKPDLPKPSLARSLELLSTETARNPPRGFTDTNEI